MARAIKRSDAQKFWMKEIAAAKKREEKWREKGEKVVKRYRDNKNGRLRTKFNLFWSITEILKAATFSRVPPPNVTRRFKTDGEVPRRASELLERCLDFYSGVASFTDNIRQARDDMLIPGRGTVWIQYNAVFQKIELEIAEDVFDLEDGTQDTKIKFMLEDREFEPDGFDDEDAQTGPFIEELETESVGLEFVFWQDFLQSGSRSWEKTWWVARQHGMDRQQLVDMFGEDVIAKIDTPSEEEKDSDGNKREVLPVWEIWDKARGERIWFTDRATDTIDREDVPLDLEGFYPCPKPIMPFETTDTMVPVPEFCIYQDQANEIDIIVTRLSKLTRALRAVGIYDAMNGEAIDLSQYDDGVLVPVNMAEFGVGGKLADQIHYMPLAEIAAVMDKLEARKTVLKNEIFEITGVSDVIRGATDPSETATAQRLKGSFGSLRLRPRREPIEEMIRDIYRIMAEVISDKFSIQTIQAITGMEVTEEIEAFMRNDTLRTFRIDVETDSTVQPNQEIDKRNAMDFVTTMGAFLQQAIPAAQAVPQLAPILGGMIKLAAENMKGGRVLEGLIDEAMDKMIEAAQNPQPKPPSPEQIEAQIKQKELESKSVDQKLKAADIQSKAIIAQQRNEAELTIAQINAGKDITIKQMDAQIADGKNQTDIITNQLDVLAAGVRIN